MQVLLIEDEAPLLEALRDFLELEGLRPVGTPHPDLAIPLAEEIHPDVIVIDVMLSGASGIEVAVRLRDGVFERTPIMAVSASALMLDFARQMGVFDDYLLKPFDLDDFLGRIRGLLARNDEPSG